VCAGDSLHCAGRLTLPVAGSRTRLLGNGTTDAEGSNSTTGPVPTSLPSLSMLGQPVAAIATSATPGTRRKRLIGARVYAPPPRQSHLAVTALVMPRTSP